MPFVYRLQKVQELRERRKQEQERRVQKARERVREVEKAIESKKAEIRQVRDNMLVAGHMMLQASDMFLQRLQEQLQTLYEDLERAKQELEYQMQLLIKAQAELEALNKHREKAYEEYLEEEKQKELKLMDEIAGQRYFRKQLENADTEAMDELSQLEESEVLDHV